MAAAAEEEAKDSCLAPPTTSTAPPYPAADANRDGVAMRPGGALDRRADRLIEPGGIITETYPGEPPLFAHEARPESVVTPIHETGPEAVVTPIDTPAPMREEFPAEEEQGPFTLEARPGPGKFSVYDDPDKHDVFGRRVKIGDAVRERTVHKRAARRDELRRHLPQR